MGNSCVCLWLSVAALLVDPVVAVARPVRHALREPVHVVAHNRQQCQSPLSKHDTAQSKASTGAKGHEKMITHQSAISRLALSTESEPWQMLRPTSMEKSPRIVPGADSSGSDECGCGRLRGLNVEGGTESFQGMWMDT